MKMILVDSSVWIDFFNGAITDATDRLAALMEDTGSPVAVADLILFEVLRGFRDEKDFLAARRVMVALPMVSMGGDLLALRAADHYRVLRSQGYTIRSPIDVLLATFCIDNDWALLHSDRDFDVLESMRGLKVWRH